MYAYWVGLSGRGTSAPERWAHLVGAPQIHPHKRWANYAHRKDRGPAGTSAIRTIFWRKLTN
jgi:hypothetical protein